MPYIHNVDCSEALLRSEAQVFLAGARLSAGSDCEQDTR